MDYKIALQAIVDSKSLESDLTKKIKELQAKGKTVLDIKIKTDAKGLETATIKYKDQLKTVTEQWRIVDGKLQEVITKHTNIAKIQKDSAKETEQNTKTILKYNQQIAKEEEKARKEAERLAKEKERIANSSGRILQRVMQYAAAWVSVHAVIRQVQEGMRYIADLNKEMTNIQVLQVEGASTDAEIKQLANTYNDLAKELGATTLETARGSVEWLSNQGHVKLL